MRVEVRHGASPPVAFDVVGEEFLIGSVPGCDLRLPGAGLPPNICLIRRGPEGVRLRKLAPALPILLNGSPISPAGQAELRHGDIVTIGPVDLHVAVDFAIPNPVPYSAPAHHPRHDLDRQARELEARARAIEEQARELEADRVLWYERRQEMESEIRAAREELELARRRPDHSTHPVATISPAFEAELRARIQREVAEEYRERREELDRLQLAVREAAVQLKERKQHFDDSQRNIDPRARIVAEHERTLTARDRALADREAELARQQEAFESERRVAEVRLQQREQDLARREVELASREMEARERVTGADRDRQQYANDLIRIDRLSAALEAKQQALEERGTEIDRRYDQFRQDTRDFEEHLRAFDEREDRAKADDVRLAARQAELDAREAELNRRLAEAESQQVTLVALRTRLEQLRNDLHDQESRIVAERARTESEMQEAQQRLLEAERAREDALASDSGRAEAHRLFEERSALLAQAAERMHGLQEQLEASEARLREREAEMEARSASIAEETGLLRARAEQLTAAQERFEIDRLAIREREAALRQAEDAREALQDQLRQRAEELTARQLESDARIAELNARAAELASQVAELEALRADAAQARRLTDEEAAVLAGRDEKLRLAEQQAQEREQALAEARSQFDLEHAQAAQQLAAARAEIEELKEALSAKTADLLGRMPDLEQRAQSALERTAQAREAMRAQLAELHAYAMRGQEDLQAIRGEVQAELGRLREQEQSLNRAKAEHRLSVSTFRQQLIEWQGRFAELKQALHQGETRLDRREKLVEANEVQLARQAEEIRQTEQEVTEKRTEVDKHLTDMRAWYRQKFREIAETRWSKFHGAKADGAESSGIIKLPPREGSSPTSTAAMNTSDGRAILPLPDDLDPADRKLGELLRTLDIIDRDTLPALWEEARRQRRTLRQVLLAGGYLTLYQLALIESGNLSGLMLGRFRVIDRLLSTPREAIYRVFDPQLGLGDAEAGTCLLRHLGEPEMLDAVRPDEYRQRFGAARDLAHPNVAATLEVSEINGRPAIIQEWLRGLSAADWPAAIASPGVWHRLMLQTAQGLHAAHSVGLTHGRLTPSSLLLTRSGVVKLVGIGEPPWLHPGGGDHEPTAEDDLRALGQIAYAWMNTGARRRTGKQKPFPNGLMEVVRSLGVAVEESGPPLAVYPSAAALLDDLDRVAAEVPADLGAWEKLLEYASENSGDPTTLRQSA